MTSNYDLIAAFYDVDMGRNQTHPDATFLRACVDANPGSVLELGCGTGRILERLVGTGTPLVGLDLSYQMLLEARLRLPQEVHLVQGDIRSIPLARHFDWVLLPYSLVTYLVNDADWRDFSASLQRVTHSTSRVVFDSFIPQPLAADGQWHNNYERVWRDGWLRRTRRITHVAPGCNQIERCYEYRPGSNQEGAFKVTTFETIRTYEIPELLIRIRSMGWATQDPILDYGELREPASAQFYCILANRIS